MLDSNDDNDDDGYFFLERPLHRRRGAHTMSQVEIDELQTLATGIRNREGADRES